MNWHYSENGQARGPVSEEEFVKLVKQGVINSETYLWCEGMADWKKYGELVPEQSSASLESDNTLRYRAPQFGIFNLKGAAADPLIAEDTAALEPVLGHAIQSTDVVPKCDVLFIYCDLDMNGRVRNSQDGLREIIRDAGARVVVVASENHGKTYVAFGGESRGKNYGKANIVMTLQRNGPIFPSFFARLFTDMKQRGVSMGEAYVKLCPQHPGGGSDDVPVPFSRSKEKYIFSKTGNKPLKKCSGWIANRAGQGGTNCPGIDRIGHRILPGRRRHGPPGGSDFGDVSHCRRTLHCRGGRV